MGGQLTPGLVMTEGLEVWDSHWPSIIDNLLEKEVSRPMAAG